MDLKEARQRHYGFVSSLILLDDIGVLSFPSEYNVKMGGGWWRVCVWWGGGDHQCHRRNCVVVESQSGKRNGGHHQWGVGN